eukprot:scaffold3002_cov64-Attheya_sp.AAC.6
MPCIGTTTTKCDSSVISIKYPPPSCSAIPIIAVGTADNEGNVAVLLEVSLSIHHEQIQHDEPPQYV